MLLTNDALREAKLSGMSNQELAQLFSCGERTISRHLKALGLTKPVDRTDIKDEDILSLWNGGLTIVEIAKRFSASHETITKRLEKHGISCDRVSGIKRHFSRTHGDMWPEIKQDLDGEMGLREISEKYHIRIDNLYKLMFQYSYLGMVGDVSSMSADDMYLEYRNRLFRKHAVSVHGDSYDYSKVVYVDIHTKVEIVCPIHGSFLQLPSNHLCGHGCPCCSGAKSRQTFLLHYGTTHPMKSESVRNRTKETCEARYGHSNVMHVNDIKNRMVQSKLVNRTCNTSEPEEKLYSMLCDLFGETDVFRQYISDWYLFACDFYIKSRNLYIELNAFWTHGGCWYDNSNDMHRDLVQDWADMGTEYYRNAIRTWTESDVRKRETARKNRLNYLVFWQNDLSDVEKWMVAGCPDGKDYEREYSWKDVR